MPVGRGIAGSGRRTAKVGPVALVAALVAVAAACADAPPVVTLGPATDVVSVAEPDLVPPLRFRGADLVDGAGRVVLIHRCV